MKTIINLVWIGLFIVSAADIDGRGVLGSANAVVLFSLEGECRVIGTVVDTSDAAVSGALVTVTRPDAPQFKLTKTTDARGRFSLLILDATKQYRIRVEKDGFQPLEQDLKPVAGDSIRVTLTLKPA